MHTSPDLLALLALGEHVGVEEDLVHIAGCPSCRTELTALTSVAQRGRGVAADDVLVTPRPEVWDRISTELHLHTAPSPLWSVPTETARFAGDTGRHEPPASSPAPDAAATGSAPSTLASSRRTRAAAFALAAVLALAVGIGLGSNLDRILPGSREVAAIDLNALPAWAGADGRAVVEADRDGNRYLVVQAQVPQAPPGAREVWLTDTTASTMYALGYLDDGQGRFAIPPDVDLARFRLVDISQEPPDDRDFRHSGESMLRGKLPV